MVRPMSDSRPVGRPLEFHPDEALESAMGLFWERGYEATSVQELESATGLNRASLYNAFGSKHDLYLKALSRYLEKLGELMFSPLEGGSGGLEDVEAFLERLRRGIGRGLEAPPSVRGCMMIDGMIEFGGADPKVAVLGDRFCRRFVSAMTLALQRAADRGQIGREAIDAKVRLLLAIALGVNVTSSSGASAREIGALVDAARDLVGSWRLPPARAVAR